jgi:hypothetical protein
MAAQSETLNSVSDSNIRLTVDTYGHLNVADLREAMEMLGKATGVRPDSLDREAASHAPGPTRVQASAKGQKKRPGPRENPETNRVLVLGAEHRVRTGDLRLGKALLRSCKPMQSESTLRNLSRRPTLLKCRLCQQMQRNASGLLTQD